MKKTITILGHKVNVKTEKLKDLHGDYCSDNMEIRIDSGSKIDYNQVLLHEITHAILDITGQSEIINSRKKEEAIVKAIEMGLWPLIKSGVFSDS